MPSGDSGRGASSGAVGDTISGRWRKALATLRAVLMVAVASALLAGCASSSDHDPAAAESIAAQAVLAMRTTPLERRPPEPDWTKHFKDMSHGAILVNLNRKFLGYWEPNGSGYHVFPIAVPLNEDLKRTGNTKVVRRRENPDWRPTPEMRKRNPKLPEYIGPGPHNPLGERALYLGWRYYAIHGTNNPNSIGTQATSGCIRMLPKDILWLYEHALVGTPVRVLDDFEVGPPASPRSGERYSAAVE